MKTPASTSAAIPEIQKHKLWFNHPFINRDDSRVAFVVVYWDDAGARKTVCLTMNLEGGDIRILNDLGTSHCDWRTKDVIFGWFTTKEGVNFYLVNDATGEYQSVRPRHPLPRRPLQLHPRRRLAAERRIPGRK